MALEIVTDRKHDKTEQNGQEYTRRERDWTCVLFCVLPSFVLTDNKCILSCAVIWSKYPTERKQRRPENETVHGIYISLFWFLGDQVERAVHKVRRLRKKTGEAVTGPVKGKVLATSFLIDRSSLPGPHV